MGTLYSVYKVWCRLNTMYRSEAFGSNYQLADNNTHTPSQTFPLNYFDLMKIISVIRSINTEACWPAPIHSHYKSEARAQPKHDLPRSGSRLREMCIRPIETHRRHRHQLRIVLEWKWRPKDRQSQRQRQRNVDDDSTVQS